MTTIDQRATFELHTTQARHIGVGRLTGTVHTDGEHVTIAYDPSRVATMMRDEVMNTPTIDVKDMQITGVTPDEKTLAALTEDPKSLPETMSMNRNILRGLGSCDTGIRQFRKAFPGDDPTVEIRQSVCVGAAAILDWDWIVSHMLTYDGQAEFERIRTSRAERYAHFGNTAKVRRASVFGWLFENRPAYRSSQMIEAVRTADARADEQTLNVHRRLEQDLMHSRQRLLELQRAVVELGERIPNLERELTASTATNGVVLARVAQRKIDRSAAEVAEYEAAFTNRRQQHERLIADLSQQLIAVEATTTEG